MRLSVSIELEELVKKSVCPLRIGMSATAILENKKAKAMGLLLCILSAILPPNQPPIAIPKRVRPITEVHVYTDAPIMGATIRVEMSSTTITEKPAKNELST